MPGAAVGQLPGPGIEQEAGHGADLSSPLAGGEAVQVLQCPMRREAGEQQGGQGRTELAHHRGGGGAVPDHVADDEGHAAAVDGQDVVPVTSGAGAFHGRQVAGGDGYSVQSGQLTGQEGALERVGHLAAGIGERRPLERNGHLSGDGEQEPAFVLVEGAFLGEGHAECADQTLAGQQGKGCECMGAIEQGGGQQGIPLQGLVPVGQPHRACGCARRRSAAARRSAAWRRTAAAARRGIRPRRRCAADRRPPTEQTDTTSAPRTVRSPALTAEAASATVPAADSATVRSCSRRRWAATRSEATMVASR